MEELFTQPVVEEMTLEQLFSKFEGRSVLVSPVILGGTLTGNSYTTGDIESRLEMRPPSNPNIGMVAYNTAGTEVLKFMIDGPNAGDLTIVGTITATAGEIGGWTLGATTISATGVTLSSAGDAHIAFGTTPPTSPTVGTGIFIDKTGLFGLNANTQNFKIDATNGNITSIAGTIGGWNITSDRLQSTSSGARIELDKANLRVSIFDATNEKVVMGYLNGLPKNDGTGNWGASNYGFWARSGDKLSIDGDGEYVDGDWIIQNDSNYLVQDASNNTIIRLGTDTGEKGLFIYDTAGVKLAKYISDEIYIGTTTGYLKYTVADGIQLYSNIADGLTLDYGSNILLKEGGDIKFTSVTAPTACTAALAGDGAGNVDDGAHIYKVTYVNAAGETELGAVSNTITVVDKTADGQVSLTDIPTSSSGSVTSRKIYRTKAGAASYYLLTTIANNTTTTYTDNTADADLGAFDASLLKNTTYGGFYADDSGMIIFQKDNVFIGINSGESNTTGSLSVAIGNSSLKSNTSGYSNVAMGSSSLYNNSTGYRNVAVGDMSLYTNSTGETNTAVGHYSLKDNTTGNSNTAIGGYCLLVNTEGIRNAALGYQALRYNTTGTRNTAIGHSSLNKNTTGENNTAIGYFSFYNNETGDKNIAIGNYAGYYETGSNALYIDNQDRTNTAGDKSNAIIYGVMAAATANQTLRVNANLGILTNTFGTSADGVLGIANGTVPSTSPADMIQIFSTDISGGDATLGLRTEATVAADVDETKFSHKLPVKINGSTYYIMLTAT